MMIIIMMLLGGLLSSLIIENKKLKNQIKYMHENPELYLKINDAIKEADENERWG